MISTYIDTRSLYQRIRRFKSQEDEDDYEESREYYNSRGAWLQMLEEEMIDPKELSKAIALVVVELKKLININSKRKPKLQS
jgi:hypothetical protein